MTKSSKTNAAAQTISNSTYVARDIQFQLPNIRLFLKRLSFRKRSVANDSPMESSLNKPKKVKRIFPIALLVVIIGAVILVTGRMLQFSTRAASQDQRATIPGPRATDTLNKQFSFPITDDKGKEVTKLQYNIDSAEIRDEIIVQGTRAIAIKGRTFLILNLKLVNTYEKTINMNARDYIRLVVNGNTNELTAPDIHNDPVNVQATSTKDTRLGFEINDTDINHLSLQVGEIKGNKETVPLKF